MPEGQQPERELTYGEKAVGLTFNPSGDATVLKVKQLYAEIIDLCYKAPGNMDDAYTMADRLFASAIDQAIIGQILAVKAITWKE